MNPELEQLAQRAVGALLTGLYQGLLLALVLWVGLKILRGTNAATRHAVGFIVLLVMSLLPCLHFLMPGGGLIARDVISTERIVEPAGTPASGGVRTTALLNQVGQEPSRLPGDAVVPAWPGPMLRAPFTAEVTDETLPEANASESLPASGLASAGIPELVPEVAAAVAASGRAPFALSAARQWQAEVPGVVSVVALAIVGAIAAMRLIRLAGQGLTLMHLKRTATPADSELAGNFAALQQELKVNRPVRLLVDHRIATPMAVGYFRPVVLLPAGLVAGSMEHGLEGILRHELAHIQRRDDWWNLLQQVIAAIQFFHPAVAWLSHRLTLEREVACDDFALAQCGSRRDYALLLTEFAGRNRGREWIAAPAAWSNRSQLKERINMILDPHRNTSRRLARTSAGVLTVATLATAGLALIAGPRLVLAASDDNPSTPSAADAAGVTLVSPSGDELIVHAGEAPSPGGTISTSADVAWNVEHDVSHAVTLGPGPGVVISARPAIKVVPAATIAVPGSSGFVVAQAPPPEPAQPADVRPPKAPKPARAPKALSIPAAEHPLPPANPDDSIEQRMERLERMIEQLVGGDRKFHFDLEPGKEIELKRFEWHNQAPPPGEPFAWNVPHPDQHWPLDEAQRKAMEKSVKAAERQMERAMQEVQREVARATEESMRVRRDGELRAQLEVKKEFGHTTREAELQRKALEGQRRSIEREMENLGRHLERLEQQMEKLDDQMERLDEREEEADNREKPVDETDAQPRVKEKADKP